MSSPPASPQAEKVPSDVSHSESEQSICEPPRQDGRLKRWARTSACHLKKHTGLGAICAVAYFDPGNWSVDLQAGSEFGYKLLFVVLLSGIMAVVFQAMASRLGCVTGLDLASHCRLLLYDRPKHKRFYRWALLYPLYVLCEIAIISTDLAELLGSATALSLLFPSLPLWAGVLITASDVLLMLAFCDPTRGHPQRFFELTIGILVVAVFVCLAVVIAQVTPNWANAFDGFLPSATLVRPGALYTSIGIVGATVMPHGLFLGSSLATQDRVSETKKYENPSTDSIDSEATLPVHSSANRKTYTPRKLINAMKQTARSAFRSWKLSQLDDVVRPDGIGGHANWENKPLSFVRAHLRHGITDIVVSLLGFATTINSLILILASAVFYYSPKDQDPNGDGNPADLFRAHSLINRRVGSGAAVLFALALLCAGESAGITATLAGQVVSEGFLRWHISPVLRRAFTRLIGLVPSMLVAAIMGRQGLNTLLVASQVVLSFVLPFVAFPLVWITSSSKLMRVKVDSSQRRAGAKDNELNEHIDFSNSKLVMVLGYLIWLLVLVANGYVLITLAMGKDGCKLEFMKFLAFKHSNSPQNFDEYNLTKFKSIALVIGNTRRSREPGVSWRNAHHLYTTNIHHCCCFIVTLSLDSL